MAAYARTPSALTWLRVNHLINGLHMQISCKNCLYAINSYFTLYEESSYYNQLSHTVISSFWISDYKKRCYLIHKAYVDDPITRGELIYSFHFIAI